MHVLEKGCSKTEILMRKVGESVVFDMSLTYEGSPNSCIRDEIIDVVLYKDGPRVEIRYGYCSKYAVNCSVDIDRVSASPRTSRFQFDNISLTLNDLVPEDEGNYSIRVQDGFNAKLIKNVTLIIEGKNKLIVALFLKFDAFTFSPLLNYMMVHIM